MAGPARCLMKLKAEIDGRVLDVEIVRNGERIDATIDGRRYDVEVETPEPGVTLIRHHDKVTEAAVVAPAKPGDSTKVTIDGREIRVTIVDPRRLRTAGSAHQHTDGLAEIRSAMHGKVIRYLVEAGDEVASGDGVVIVEAMKMQNELKSPKDGTIKELRAEAGATVAAGDVLATVK